MTVNSMAEILKTPLILQRQDTSHPLSPWKIQDLTLHVFFSFFSMFCLLSVKNYPNDTAALSRKQCKKIPCDIFRELTPIFKEMRVFHFQIFSLSAFLRRKWCFLRQYYESYFSGGQKIVKIWIINKWSAVVIRLFRTGENSIKRTKNPKQTYNGVVKARLHRRFLSHQVSNMFETPGISRRQIALKIAPGLHVRFKARQKLHRVPATKIACVNGP